MNTAVESQTIRISARSKSALRELANNEGKSMQSILDAAIERYQRDALLDSANAAFARLRSDQDGWKEELSERRAWEGTLADGVESE